MDMIIKQTDTSVCIKLLSRYQTLKGQHCAHITVFTIRILILSRMSICTVNSHVIIFVAHSSSNNAHQNKLRAGILSTPDTRRGPARHDAIDGCSH